MTSTFWESNLLASASRWHSLSGALSTPGPKLMSSQPSAVAFSTAQILLNTQNLRAIGKLYSCHICSGKLLLWQNQCQDSSDRASATTLCRSYSMLASSPFVWVSASSFRQSLSQFYLLMMDSLSPWMWPSRIWISWCTTWKCWHWLA